MIRVTPAVRRAGYVLLLGLTAATCRDDALGPGRGARASLALAPVLPAEVAGLAAFGLSIDSLRVLVRRPPSDTVADTTVAFAADLDSLRLAVSVVLAAPVETLQVTVELRGAGFALFTATAAVAAHEGDGGANPPVEIANFVYAGPGAGVTSLTVTPVDSVIRLSDSLRFRVDALAGTVPVTQFYVSWSTDNPTLAPINAHGVLRAPNQRGVAFVTARTPTNVTATVPVTFVPVPVSVTAVSTPPQNVLPGASIGPLRVRVLAADGLGVKGTPVAFQAVSGGGAVTSSQVVTDGSGFAETPATAGTAGVNVFSATVAGVATPALFNVTVLSTAGTQLVFTAPPAAAVTGVPFGAVVEVRDAQGALAASATDAVTIALGANPGGAALSGTQTVNAVAGVAVFADLTLDQSATGYTLVATAPGLAPDTTPPFDVIAGFTGRLWTNAAGGNWSDPANWSGNIVPGPTDTVYIAADGTYTVTLDVNPTVAFLFVGGSTGIQTLAVTGHTLGIDSGVVFNVQSALTLANAAINTSPTGSVVSFGAIAVGPGTSQINSSLFLNSGAVLRLNGNNGPAVLVSGGEVLNFGTIELTGTSWGGQLSVTTGSLVNGPGATLQVVNGAGNSYTGTLVNQGSVQVDGPWTLSGASATHLNLGTITLGTGNWTLTQTGTTPSFTTTGTVTIGPGRTWTVNGGVLDYANAAPGGLTGAGTIALSGATLNLTPDLTHDALTLSLTNTTVNGPGTLVVAGPTPLVVSTSTVNAALVNQGTLQTNPGTVVLNGAVTNQSGAVLRLLGNNGPAVLTVANGFTNQGTIELTGTSWGGQLSVTSGTLVNAPGATLQVSGGAGNSYTGTLDNQGTVQVDGPWTLAGASADHLNSGTIVLGTNNWTLSQTGTTPTFATTGTIVVGAARTWSVNGGALNYQAGALGGTGVVALNAVTLGLGVSLTHDTLALSLTNTTVNGPGTLTVAGQATLGATNSTINAALVNQGTIQANPGTVALNGALTNGTGALLRLLGNNGPAVVTVANGFTNQGTIELTGTSWGGQLNVTTGPLVNAPGATLRALGGAGNAYTGTLDNQGTVQVDGPWTLAGASAAHLNAGTITLGAGDWTLSQTGTTPSFATAGTVTVGAGRTWNVSGGALNYQAGALGGNGLVALNAVTLGLGVGLTHDTLTLSLTNTTVNGPGTLTVAGTTPLPVTAATITAAFVNLGTVVANPGTNALTGTVMNQSGALLRLLGNNGPAVVTVANGFTNQGTIELTGTSWGGQLSVTSGSLVNAPGGVLRALGGAGNSYTGTLDNQGTIQVDGPWTLAGASAAHQNSGTIVLGAADWTLNQSGTTPSFTTTGTVTVGAGRTWTVSGGGLDYQGGALGGKGVVTLNAVTLGLGVNLTHDTLTLSLTNTTVNGPDTLTVAGLTPMVVTTSTVNAALVNQGTLQANPGTNALNGAVSNQSGALLRLSGNNGPAVVTVANGFTNQGTIELTGTSWGGQLSVAAGTLVNAPGATLRSLSGAGNAYTGTLNNQGTVQVDGPWTLAGASAAHLNAGTVQVAGGDLTITQTGTTPTFTNQGLVAVAASRSLVVTGGTLNNAPTGTLAGAGTLNVAGTVFNQDGAINPGGSPGTLTITGALPSTATAVLNVEIGGTLATEYDRIAVSGTATMDGTLNITLLGGFVPAIGNTFTILTAGSVVGAFGLSNLPVVAGAAWQVIPSATAVTLSLVSSTQAAVKVWNNALGGNWSTPTNWLPPGAPTTADSVVIELLGTYTVNVDVAATAFFVNLGGPVGTGTRTLSLAAASLTLSAGALVGQTGVLNVSGGTLTGGGDVLVGGNMTWTGGTVSGVGFLTVSPSGTLTLSGGPRNLTTRSLLNQGTVLWSGGNINGSSTALVNAGTLDAQADAMLAWTGGATPTFENQAAGTVLRRVATGSLVFDAPVTNAGAFDVQSGRVRFTRGGSSATTFSVQTGATLEFGAGSFTLATGADVLGAGAVDVTAGVLDVAAADTVRVGRLHHLGGTILGAGVLRPDSVVWTAGTQQGGGATHVAPGAILLVNGPVNWQRPIVNEGTLLWTAGNIAGGSVTLQNAGLFDMQLTTGSLYWAAGATPVLDNLATGSVLRRVGAGTVIVDVTLNNAGTFDVQSGRVELFRGGTSVTDFTVQSGTTLELAAGNYTLGTGMDFAGTGVAELTGATLDITAADTVQATRLHQLGGIITGAGVLRADSLVWTAGTQQGAGATHVAAGTTLLVNGTISWQRPLVNQGTIVWTAGNIAGGNVTLQNAGLFDMQPATGSLYWAVGAPPLLDNQATGSVLRRVGTGTVTVDVTLNNAGTFDVQSGRVELTRGGASAADLTVQPGTTLELAAGSYQLGTGMDFAGTGLVELTAAAVDVAASDTVRVSRLHQLGGTIQGAGVLRADSLVWTAGTQLGAGATYVAAGATLLVNGSISWQRALANQGTILWTAGNIAGASATLQNASLFDMQVPAGTFFWASGATPLLDNLATGSVLRRAGAGIVTIDVTVNNAGTFDVQSGRVELTRGGSSTSDYAIQPGTTLELAAGAYTLGTGMDFVGSGVVELTGAVLDVTATDTVRVSRFHQLGGTIQGPGVFQPDSLTWTAGAQQGAGSTHIAVGATLLVNGTITFVRPLLNQGTIRWTSGIIAGGSVTLQNRGLFDMVVPTGAFNWGLGPTPPLLDNQPGGSVVRRVGTGVATVGVTVNNDGTLDAQTGILSLERGGSGKGQYLVSNAAATLRFGGVGAHTLSAGAKIGGSGLVNFTGVDVSISGTGSSYDVTGTTQIVAGSVDFSTPDTARFTTFNQLGGFVRGTAPLLVRGSGSWTGGTLEGGAGSALLIPSGANLSIAGAATKFLTGRTILASGPVTWSAGSVTTAGGAGLDVQPSNTFEVSSTGQWAGASTIEIRDRAVMKVSSAGSVAIGPTTVLNIGGALDIQAGATVKMTGDFNLLGTGELLGSGTLDVAGTSKVTNAGAVRPGTSPGVLSILGNWPQATGSLYIDILGVTPGTGHDQLAVSGVVTTGGTLVLIGDGTFVPPAGLELTIMTFGGLTGQNFAVTTVGIGPPRNVNYKGTSLTVSW